MTTLTQQHRHLDLAAAAALQLLLLQVVVLLAVVFQMLLLLSSLCSCSGRAPRELAAPAAAAVVMRSTAPESRFPFYTIRYAHSKGACRCSKQLYHRFCKFACHTWPDATMMAISFLDEQAALVKRLVDIKKPSQCSKATSCLGTQLFRNWHAKNNSTAITYGAAPAPIQAYRAAKGYVFLNLRNHFKPRCRT
jgi:hypothetical protein